MTQGSGIAITNTAGGIQIDATGGGGDAFGAASSTNNAIALFSGTLGKTIKNSLVTIGTDGAITAPQVGSMIPFYYANYASFPSASSSHGALAHSHANGAMYYAHGGNWIQLFDYVTPGSSANVLTSNGSTWVSTAPAAGGVTTGKAIAMALVFGG